MALSFPTKQTPPQANRSATYSLIAHSKVALATITTFQHAVVPTQNAGPAFSNGPQRHTECYTYPDTNGIMSACGYLKKNVKTQSTGQWKQALWEKTLHASFTSLHSQAHVSPFPCTLAEATSSPRVSLWENIWRVGVGIPICVEGCERHYPPPQRREHNEPNEHWRETGALQMSSLWTLILASVYFVIHFNQTLLPHPRTWRDFKGSI